MFLRSYEEVREQLQQMQNPLFLYDNDADGLCSFVLLRKWLGRGTGVAVRSYPEVSEQYLTQIDLIKADGVVVLDKHAISWEVIEGIKQRGLQVVWIDHHDVNYDIQEKSDMIYYFNPRFTIEKKNSYPTSYHAQMISNQRKDLWISLVGCVSDCYLPDFYDKVKKNKESLLNAEIKTAFDVYYRTEIGKIALYLNFSLKNSASKVIEMQDFLIKCNEPEEILDENDKNPIIVHASAMLKKCNSFIDEAKSKLKDNSVFFAYSGDTSMSSEISNALSYEFPGVYIAIAFRRQGIVNISLRGKDVKTMLDEIIAEIGAGTGGGHQDAVGARIPRNKLDDFERIFREKAKIKA